MVDNLIDPLPPVIPQEKAIPFTPMQRVAEANHDELVKIGESLLQLSRRLDDSISVSQIDRKLNNQLIMILLGLQSIALLALVFRVIQNL